MNLLHWIDNELLGVPAIKAVAIICLCCAFGLALGKIRFRGIRLGVTFVFFVGLLVGGLGVAIDHQMLIYAEDFGLIIFVYVLGLQVGPGFMSSFHAGGTRLSLLSMGVVLTGTLMALLPVLLQQMPLGEMMGVLCGATTNTPALAAAQQAFTQVGHPSEGIASALSLGVTYPVGMIGVIVALIVIRVFLVRSHHTLEEPDHDEAFIASFLITNPDVFDLRIVDCVKRVDFHFVVSRIWRDDRVILPFGDTALKKGDRLLIIMQEKDVAALAALLGQVDKTDWNKKNIDWNKLDAKLVSERILITNKHINGKRLGALHLRNRFGVTVSRVKRSGLHLVATPDLVLRMGDRLTVVGEAYSCHHVADELGNRITALNEPNMVTIFIGMVLGLLLGYIPIAVPGMSVPLRLGLAGGPIVMGILIGAFGPRIHMVTYVTTSANMLIRSLGLATYLACLGLDAGPQFVSVVMRPAALVWVGFSGLIAVVPVLLFAWIAMRWCKCGYATSAGMLCGAMANPIALDYYNTTVKTDNANVAYATVYPLSMFVRIIVAQLIVVLCCS